jgi:hypothetical protein
VASVNKPPFEALERFLSRDPQATALLLFEDTDVLKRRAIVDERVGIISTGDFLRELEAPTSFNRAITSSMKLPRRAAMLGSSA